MRNWPPWSRNPWRRLENPVCALKEAAETQRPSGRIARTAFGFDAGITAVYLLSTFAGGLVAGKLAKIRRFLWGIVLGILYFAFLLLITWGIYRTFHGSETEILMTFALCAGGGMAGGMIS